MDGKSASKPRILVVDDEAGVCEALALDLVLEGFEVQCASDGREALALLGKWPADLVLTDLYMPGGDGFELIRHMKQGVQHPPPVILLSALASQAMEEARRLGVHAVLPKPFERQALFRAVGAALLSRAARRQP